MPEKLYWREREIETLHAAFDRVVSSGGGARCLLTSSIRQPERRRAGLRAFPNSLPARVIKSCRTKTLLLHPTSGESAIPTKTCDRFPTGPWPFSSPSSSLLSYWVICSDQAGRGLRRRALYDGAPQKLRRNRMALQVTRAARPQRPVMMLWRAPRHWQASCHPAKPFCQRRIATDQTLSIE